MGSIARLNRCERYIEEFNEDARRDYGPREEHKHFFKRYSLGMGDDELVHMYYSTDPNEEEPQEFMALEPPHIFFDPEEPYEDCISRVEEIYQLTREEAVARLRKAELIPTPVR